LLVVLVIDIHLSLDLALKSVLQGLQVLLRQCFGWVVFFQQKTILSMNVIPKLLGLLSSTIDWIECHIDIGFAKYHIFHCNKICSFGRPPKRWGACFGSLGECLVMWRAWRRAYLLFITAHGVLVIIMAMGQEEWGNGAMAAMGMGQRPYPINIIIFHTHFISQR
jgi:hypothetical protein